MKTLRHRGPDEDGVYISRSVALGHTRLSIIDLHSGKQPVANENGLVQVVANCEIYNYQELRNQLESRGHRFRTRSDTEVVPHAYEEWGERCVEYFNGMFAIALWDEGRRRLLLYRDRMGQKPLYYAEFDGGLLFGSEPKSILAYPKFRPVLSLRALAMYLVYEYVPTPYTIYDNIFRLEPGAMALYDDGRLKKSIYWDINFEQNEVSSEEELCEKIRAGLRESVRLRLRSDVEVGIFLSGGIDSSTVAYFASEVCPIKTFSIGFMERSFDESNYALQVARRIGADHYCRFLTQLHTLQLIPEVLSLLDEPFADASAIPTYLLSRYAREFVKVALGGDGGDELFAGYPTFPADRLAEQYSGFPEQFRRVLRKLASALPTLHTNFSFDYLIKQFLKGECYDRWRRHQVWLGSFSPEELKELLSEDVLTELDGFDPLHPVGETIARAPTDDPINKLVYLYAKFYLHDDILVKVDRMSMACGLEVRAPFLDWRFVNLVCSLPGNLKLRGLRTKHILKEAMRELLPRGVADRRKKGFGVPLARWFRNQLKPLILDTLSRKRLQRDGLFNPAAVERIIHEHLSGEKDNRKQLWTLFVFNEWLRKSSTKV